MCSSQRQTLPGTAQSKWELFDGIISRAQGGPRDRRGTAISCSESPQCPRNQIECPSWRYWPSLSPSRRRGGAACAGPGRAGRSIRAQQPDPPAGPPPDSVRRRWGARLFAKQYYGRGHRWKGGSDASVAADHTETTFGTCRTQPADLGRHPGTGVQLLRGKRQSSGPLSCMLFALQYRCHGTHGRKEWLSR